jgi:hypothetical protein
VVGKVFNGTSLITQERRCQELARLEIIGGLKDFGRVMRFDKPKVTRLNRLPNKIW